MTFSLFGIQNEEAKPVLPYIRTSWSKHTQKNTYISFAASVCRAGRLSCVLLLLEEAPGVSRRSWEFRGEFRGECRGEFREEFREAGVISLIGTEEGSSWETQIKKTTLIMINS